jgi:hypothetical protein
MLNSATCGVSRSIVMASRSIAGASATSSLPSLASWAVSRVAWAIGARKASTCWFTRACSALSVSSASARAPTRLVRSR